FATGENGRRGRLRRGNHMSSGWRFTNGLCAAGGAPGDGTGRPGDGETGGADGGWGCRLSAFGAANPPVRTAPFTAASALRISSTISAALRKRRVGSFAMARATIRSTFGGTPVRGAAATF